MFQPHPDLDRLPVKQKPIVIVGAGVFGLSTAFHLLRRGYEDVTVLDRAKELPARDGAGYDMNKSTFISLLPRATARCDTRTAR